MYLYIIDPDSLIINQIKVLYSYSNKTFIEDNDYIFGERYWSKSMLEARELVDEIKEKK